MDIFSIPTASTSKDLLDSLALVGSKVGFQMKVGLDITDKVMNSEVSDKGESKYIKIDCSFPLRPCPFYLLY